MNTSFLDRLKIKPLPKKKDNIDIILPQALQKEENIISVKIIDKRNETNIDRNSILQTIKKSKNFKGVENRQPILQSEINQSRINLQEEKGRKILSDERIIEESKEEEEEEEKKKPAFIPEPELVSVSEPMLEIVPSPAEIVNIPLKKKRQLKQKQKPIIYEGNLEMIDIGDTPINKRLPLLKPKILLQASNYYINNRKIFINFISSLFSPYQSQLIEEKKSFSCEKLSDDSDFSLLSHQNIVRDYINLYTPYRGLLLYHGLGAGKTCSSIAIAEGLKTTKQIIIMTPASLRRNYIEELKKCGDPLYKKNQYWEFINTNLHPEYINILSKILSLSDSFIISQGGAWLINIKKKANYESLSSVNKSLLDEQLTEMIRYKYKFINYNGLRNARLNELSENDSINPFDNCVVIIDEAHNFVSRITNKISKNSSLSMKLYNYIMKAENAKIILLTGTPIINYPNELGILFNMLRGEIKTFTFKLNISSDRKISQENIYTLFKSKLNSRRLFDYIEYKSTSTSLIITRNPFGFISKYQVKKGIYEGVELNENGNISDADFIKIITAILKTDDIEVIQNGIKVDKYKALPDTLDEFKNYFINTEDNTIKNENLFKRRIIGLTSYFRDIEELMPRFDKGRDMHIIEIPMSDFQFGVYEEARVKERELEQLNKKRAKKKKNDDIADDSVSTYRIFSRAFCNFVFPRPFIKRPLPFQKETLQEAIEENIGEDLLDNISVEDQLENIDGKYEADDINELNDNKRSKIDITYEPRIIEAINRLWENKERFLTAEGLEIYSPKFLRILQTIQNEENIGLHLIYSQFRTLEGIGILKLVLENNGYAQFKIIKNDLGQWLIDIKEEDIGKPTFALYTGTETADEKEIIRNIYNSNWKYVPSTIIEQLKLISNNNFYGEIIKVLMITASGAEGISLRNVRFVHLVESYWHPVRLDQVIGRARRICSHNDLPIDLQNIQVFLYLMTFTKEQISGDGSIELRLKDKSKIDNSTPITSDQALYEVSCIKEKLTKQLLTAVKESAIDCTLNALVDNKENLQCFTFATSNSNSFSYSPAINDEEHDTTNRINKKEITWKPYMITINGIVYAINKLTNEIYDLESIKRKNPIKVGDIEFFVDPFTNQNRYKFIKL